MLGLESRCQPGLSGISLIGVAELIQSSSISPQQKNQLRRTFRKDLKAPVKLHLFTQKPSPIAIPGRDCPTCAQTEHLIEEITGFSTKLNLEIHDYFGDWQTARDMSVARIPAILLGDEAQPRVAFYGVPLGYQMAAIVETIRSMSRNVSGLNNDSRRKLRQVNRTVHLQVLVTPDDQHSAEVAHMAFAITRENSNVSAEAVQLRDFPSLARSLGVQGVPTVLINELYRLTAPIEEAALVEQVMLAGGASSK